MTAARARSALRRYWAGLATRIVAPVPHVLQAQRLFGEPDYLLRVATSDLTAFQQLYDQQLARLPGVQRLTSTIVMKNVVQDRPLPE